MDVFFITAMKGINSKSHIRGTNTTQMKEIFPARSMSDWGSLNGKGSKVHLTLTFKAVLGIMMGDSILSKGNSQIECIAV